MKTTEKSELPKLKLSELEKLTHEQLVVIAQHVRDLETSHKYKTLDRYLKNANEGQLAFHKDTSRIRFVLAGNRCVAKGTKIWTIDGLKNIEDLTEPTHVLSRAPTGKLLWRPSTAAYCKSGGPALEISHRRGKFVASENHQILTSEGEYRSVSNLSKDRDVLLVEPLKCFFSLLHSSLTSYLQELYANVLRSTGKSLDFCNYYLALIRQRDRRPLRHIKSVAGLTPLSLDEAVSLPIFSNETEGIGHECTHFLPESFRAYTEDYLSHPSREHVSVSSANIRNVDISVVSILLCLKILPKLMLQSVRLKAQQFYLYTLQRFFLPCENLQKNVGSLSTFYDITVQGTHNYIDEHGVVHHNSGKTTAGTIELVWRCMGIHPFQKVKIPIRSAVVLQDFESAGKNIFEPKLNEWVPQGAIKKIERHQGGCIKRITWASGSTTDVFSHDQDDKVFEGSDYDLVQFDEPCPRNIWIAMWRSCVDRGGLMFMTGTPLASPWLYEEYNKWKGGELKNVNFHIYSTELNAKNLGQGDVELGMKRLKEFSDTLSEEEREARINGSFMQLSGLIFKNWDRKTHLIKPFEWPHNWPIWESIDPHSQKDWALSYVGMAPNGAKVLIESHYVGGVLEDIAQSIVQIRQKLQIKDGLRPKITRCLIDNAASVPLWQRSSNDPSPTARRVSLKDELEAMIGPRGAGGPRIECAPKNVSQKLEIFKNWLNAKDRGDGVKRAHFYVFNNEANMDMVYEIENYVWARVKNRPNGDLKTSPVKKNDDILDTIMQVALTLSVVNNKKEFEPVSFVDMFQTYGL